MEVLNFADVIWKIHRFIAIIISNIMPHQHVMSYFLKSAYLKRAISTSSDRWIQRPSLVKIVATIGPVSENLPVLEHVVEAGMVKCIQASFASLFIIFNRES